MSSNQNQHLCGVEVSWQEYYNSIDEYNKDVKKLKIEEFLVMKFY